MGCTVIKKAKSNISRRKLSTITSSIYDDFASVTSQYTLKHLIGRGRYGRVFLGESLETKKKVAIKALPLSNPEVVVELSTLTEVNHPNIIKFIKHFYSEQYLYIIMEYCAGSDLFQKIADRERFTESEAKVIMEKLLRAVNHCHRLGIVHRDLKPENVMYTSEGVLKIIDFGLSIKTSSTDYDRFAGTASYIAPEIVTCGISTEACDLWSLGVMMHLLLTGYVPIADDSLDVVCNEIKKYNGPTFTEEVWQKVSKEARDLLKRMLEPNYKTRITADEALKHPWLAPSTDNSKAIANVQAIEKLDISEYSVVEALQRYSKYSDIKKNLLEHIVKNMNETELGDLHRVFLLLDKENTGLITSENLRSICKSEITITELDELIRNINNGKTYIKYNSFMAALIRIDKLLTEEKLESIYKEFQRSHTLSEINYSEKLETEGEYA